MTFAKCQGAASGSPLVGKDILSCLCRRSKMMFAKCQDVASGSPLVGKDILSCLCTRGKMTFAKVKEKHLVHLWQVRIF